MMYINKKKAKLRFALLSAGVLSGLSTPVWAQVLSPATSDSSAGVMPVMLGLLGGSLVLIILFVILSVKKKNGKR